MLHNPLLAVNVLLKHSFQLNLVIHHQSCIASPHQHSCEKSNIPTCPTLSVRLCRFPGRYRRREALMAGTPKACRTTPRALLPSLTCSSPLTGPKTSWSCFRMATTLMSRLQVGPLPNAQSHAWSFQVAHEAQLFLLRALLCCGGIRHKNEDFSG